MKNMLCTLCCLYICTHIAAQTTYSVYINEFLASNVSVNADIVDHDDYSDWIELYNDEEYEVNIAGFYITDDRNDPQKWQFPVGKDETIIPAKGFLLVWADGMDDTPGEFHYRSWNDISNQPIPFLSDFFHLSFNLNRAGEYIGLYAPDGSVVDSLSYDLQYRDVSMGRQPDGYGNLYFFGEPTPEASNTTAGLTEPAFSDATEILPVSGFYAGSLEVTMEDTEPGDTVFYTLDGSIPGSKSEPYESALTVNETTIVRARLFEDQKFPGVLASRTYFNGEYSQLPVISILTPPDALWDNYKGIYDNLMKEREIPVGFEYFDASGESVLNMIAGLRLTGQASLFYPNISFTLTARDRYGNDEFGYAFFPDREISSFKSLYLRNAGFPDNRDSYFRDALQAMLVINRIDLDLQAYQPAVVFLNGEYWGIYNLREKINTDYLASLHHVNPDEIDLLEYANRDPEVIVSNGSADNYLELYDYFESNDLSDDAAYQYVEERMDMDAFINYQVCNIFYDNVFWQAENVRMWREQKDRGKWRWILFDNDWSFGLKPNPRSPGYENNTIEFATSTSSHSQNPPDWSTLFFRSLLENEDFKTRFLQRFDACLNSVFHADTVIAYINRLQQTIAAEMPRHIDRWKNEDTYFTPPLPDYASWLGKVEIMREFARNRPAYQRQHIMDYFGIAGTGILEISVNGSGKVRVNDVFTSAGDFSGTWFRDIPVDLFAIPDVGYRFSGWEGDMSDTLNELTVSLVQDTLRLTASFEPLDISIVPGHLTKDTLLTMAGSPWYAGGDIVVDSNVTLTLEDGVTLLMPEEACILVYGRLIVDGTDQYLVRIGPNEYAESWGALCFINATDSSIVRNLVIRGATRGHDFDRDKAAISGYNSNFSLEYVSVNESEAPIYVQYGNVMIRGCMLSATMAGDLINVKKAGSICVEYCDLLGGDYYDSDAIDYDQLSNGIIRGNLIRNFYGFNSDAIDLGEDSHNILIEENTIANINDKGVSIGNGSDGIIRRNVFVNCGQGIGVKDYDSYGYAAQNTFYGNQYGVASFVKNTGEGGGNIEVVNSIFANSKSSPVLVDDLSVAAISYSMSNTEELEGLHNMQDDPLFLNDLRLANGSPAIDAGNPTLPDDPDGSIADLGAYPHDADNQQNLIINEIHYHPADGENRQFIELYNAGSSAIDLQDFLIWGSARFLFPEADIEAGEYLIIAGDQSVYTGNGYQVFQWDSGDLQGFPGRIHLTDDQGFTVDNVDYFNQAWWPEEPDGQGPSLELHTPLLENMASTSWRNSYADGGTPGRSNNSLLIDGIYINEFMAGNDTVVADEYDEYDDWIELYNSNEVAVNLGGLYLTDNLNNPLQHQIPMHDAEATTIPAKGFLLFWADNQPEQGVNHLSFALNHDGEEIGLAQLTEDNSRYIDSLSFPALEDNISMGRYPDGTDNWYLFDIATPEASNRLGDQIDHRILPESIADLINYPNPFPGETRIRYTLTESGFAELNIYDFTGRKVRTLFSGDQISGTYEITWNAQDCRPGIFFAELKTKNGRVMRKMVLLE